jgi:hypothetical protein
VANFASLSLTFYGPRCCVVALLVAVNTLAPIVRLYERALHSKSLLVHALDALVHGFDAAEVDGAMMAAADGEGGGKAASLLSGSGASSWDQAPAVPRSSVRALDLYAASWALDADLDVESIATAQHLWDTQVTSATAGR